MPAKDLSKYRLPGLKLSGIRRLKAEMAFYADEMTERISNLSVPEWMGPVSRFFSWKNPVAAYIRKLIGTAFEAVFLMAAVWMLCFILLYVSFLMWQLYLQTPVGQHFLVLFPEKANIFVEITELSHLPFAVDLTLWSFGISLGIAAVGHFFHINRHLYLSQGLCGKVCFWGLPLTGLVACYISFDYGFSDWKTMMLVTAVPTLLMFGSCFKFAEKLVPECGDVICCGIGLSKKIISKVSQMMAEFAK
ncbi:MAG: hypothetical protein Q7U02_01475 [Desulfosalsimonadaceae bacterium]|nr:hypothetical protein [Desulfosalsimonadaceae bacterium]